MTLTLVNLREHVLSFFRLLSDDRSILSQSVPWLQWRTLSKFSASGSSRHRSSDSDLTQLSCLSSWRLNWAHRLYDGLNSISKNLNDTLMIIRIGPMKVSIPVLQVGKSLWLFLDDILCHLIVGIAFLYWRLAQLFPAKRENYKSRAKSYVDAALGKLSGKVKIHANICYVKIVYRQTYFVLMWWSRPIGDRSSCLPWVRRSKNGNKMSR